MNRDHPVWSARHTHVPITEALKIILDAKQLSFATHVTMTITRRVLTAQAKRRAKKAATEPKAPL